MRVVVVDEISSRASFVRSALERAGCEVVAAVSSALSMLACVEREQPDLIIIDTESPSRDTLEGLAIMSVDHPRPIVMFATDRHSDTIRQVMRTGVSAYVVDGLDPERVRPILEVAVARFEEFQKLRVELASANQRLDDRKLLERAKGIVMAQQKVGEDEAWNLMRRIAMSRKEKMVAIARRIVEAG
jgi:two-component system, response regulator / RNA-binding antiterminator